MPNVDVFFAHSCTQLSHTHTDTHCVETIACTQARIQLPGATSDLLSNKEVLTRVLCHRAEREASKIMKKDRIPKKSGSGAFANLFTTK